MPTKCSITQQLWTDLGMSVGVTTTTQVVWFTCLRAQPFQQPQQSCNQKDTHFKNEHCPAVWTEYQYLTKAERFEAKSRKYQGVFKVKIRVKRWQVQGIWSQQLANKQVPSKSMETTHNSVKVKLGIKVMKLVESLIGWEVTDGKGSECHLTFVRGLLHIAE